MRVRTSARAWSLIAIQFARILGRPRASGFTVVLRLKLKEPLKSVEEAIRAVASRPLAFLARCLAANHAL